MVVKNVVNVGKQVFIDEKLKFETAFGVSKSLKLPL